MNAISSRHSLWLVAVVLVMGLAVSACGNTGKRTFQGAAVGAAAGATAGMFDGDVGESAAKGAASGAAAGFVSSLF